MTDPLFLIDLGPELPAPGAQVALTGEEGRHAAVVRRIRVGETVVLSDGQGRGLRGTVSESSKTGLTVDVVDQLISEPGPVRFVAVQALAKGDRSELAIEMLTEMGIDEIVPWQSSRSIVKWTAERGAKSLARWRSTVREATKQSRRLRIPEVSEPVNTADLVRRIGTADVAVILHEDADQPLSAIAVPESGEVLMIIGPEGGIAPEELNSFQQAGGALVSLGEGVLRTSTAGLAALATLKLR